MLLLGHRRQAIVSFPQSMTDTPRLGLPTRQHGPWVGPLPMQPLTATHPTGSARQVTSRLPASRHPPDAAALPQLPRPVPGAGWVHGSLWSRQPGRGNGTTCGSQQGLAPTTMPWPLHHRSFSHSVHSRRQEHWQHHRVSLCICVPQCKGRPAPAVTAHPHAALVDAVQHHCKRTA